MIRSGSRLASHGGTEPRKIIVNSDVSTTATIVPSVNRPIAIIVVTRPQSQARQRRDQNRKNEISLTIVAISEPQSVGAPDTLPPEILDELHQPDRSTKRQNHTDEVPANIRPRHRHRRNMHTQSPKSVRYFIVIKAIVQSCAARTVIAHLGSLCAIAPRPRRASAPCRNTNTLAETARSIIQIGVAKRAPDVRARTRAAWNKVRGAFRFRRPLPGRFHYLTVQRVRKRK